MLQTKTHSMFDSFPAGDSNQNRIAFSLQSNHPRVYLDAYKTKTSLTSVSVIDAQEQHKMENTP